MTNEIQTQNHGTIVPMNFSTEQIDLIKRTVAKGTTNDELALFLYTCKRTGLDPLLHQIHCVKRGDKITIQTGIDGYRLNAERTGKYAPGREPSFMEDKNGKVISATAYIKKKIDGEWHEVAATAHFTEYAQMFNGKLGNMWEKMPHAMLAKCAEALVLRKAFPQEMGGLYTDEEMAQADNVTVTAQVVQSHSPQRKSATEPTTEELAAKAEAAKEQYKATEATKSATTKPQGLPDGLKAKGIITNVGAPNGGGYISISVEGYQREDGKDKLFSTKNEKILDAISEHVAAGTPIEFTYTDNANPRFASSITELVA